MPKELALLLVKASTLVDDPESQDILFSFAFGVSAKTEILNVFWFIGENVDLPGVGNKVSQVKRVASEFEIPLPPVVLLSSGKSRPVNITANNSGSKNKTRIFLTFYTIP